jgi:hypothetical protein
MKEESKNPAEELKNPEELINDNSPKIIFIIPFFFPNAGKSYALTKLKAYAETLPNCSFASVSSDDIRGAATKALLESNKQLTKD